MRAESAVAGGAEACVAAGDDAFSCSRAHRQPSRRGSRADFTTAAAPDRLRCEQVCRRWRQILLQDDFVEHLVLPHDHLRRLAKPRERRGGWSMLREHVRDDSLSSRTSGQSPRKAAPSTSPVARRVTLAASSVLRKNQALAHVKMAERQADGHRLRIRPRQPVDVACARKTRERNACHSGGERGRRGKHRELEALRDVVVDAAGSRRSSASASTSGSAPRAANRLVVGGTRVVISSLTLSLLFLERVLLEANDDAFDAEDDADENDAEASVARLLASPRRTSAKSSARSVRAGCRASLSAARARRRSRRVAPRSVARKLRRVASRGFKSTAKRSVKAKREWT